MSFQIELDPKEEVAANLIADVGYQLQEALAECRKLNGTTQQSLAIALGVNRSHIHKCLSGYKNLTLNTIAELAWAMNKVPHFQLCSPNQTLVLEDETGANYFTRAIFAHSDECGSKGEKIRPGRVTVRSDLTLELLEECA